METTEKNETPDYRAMWEKLKEFVFDPDWDYSAAQVREKMEELEAGE